MLLSSPCAMSLQDCMSETEPPKQSEGYFRLQLQTCAGNARPSLFTKLKVTTHLSSGKTIKALHSWRLGSNSSFLPVFVFGNTVSYPSTCLRLMLELSHVSMTTRRRRRAVRRCVFPAVSAVLDTLRLLFAPWPPLQQRRDDLYLRSEAASPSLHLGPAWCFFSRRRVHHRFNQKLWQSTQTEDSNIVIVSYSLQKFLL